MAKLRDVRKKKTRNNEKTRLSELRWAVSHDDKTSSIVLPSLIKPLVYIFTNFIRAIASFASTLNFIFQYVQFFSILRCIGRKRMVLRENNVETSNNVVPADGIITKIHNMFWLKHQTIPVQSERKEEKMSSKSGAGERQAKNKRKPRQPKESKIPSNDSQKCMGDYFAKDGKGPIRQSAWSNEKNGVQVLFPKDETAAAVAARAEQEEDDEPLRIALEESLRMSEAKSQFEAPLADCDVEEAAERSDDDDGYWERRNIQKNLPLPDTRDNKKIYDTNNNNNGNNGKNNTSVVKSMIGKIENRPGGRCITGQKDSSVNESVNKFEAAIVRSIDKPLLLPTEKPYFVDRFGRINGQNESHVYMGRGARRKEREYIEEQQQRQQQQQQPQQQQPQQQPQRQQQQRQQQQQQQQPQQQPQQQQLQRQQQQPQQQQPQRQQQQQQQPQRQQQQQQQQQSQQQPKEQGAPYVAEKTLPYYNRPMNKYDEANCNADFKNYMHGQKNGQNQTRRPTTYAEQKPFYVDKYHYSKDYSKNPRDTNERPNENQRPLPPPSPATSINNDQKHIIPEKISSSRQISKISESPITQKFQSTIETLNSNVEKLCLVDEISQVSSFPNEMKKQKSHDENSTSKCEKKIEEIIHLSDFNSRHNSPIIEEKISSPLSEPEVIMLESGTSVEFCENNFYDDDKNFTGKIDFPQCAGISYRAPPGFQCLQQQQQHEYQSSSANYATRYPVPTQNAYESLTIHDPSLIRFLLQNSRIRENIGNYDNYTPIVDNTVDIPIQSFANTSERFAFNQQDTMKNYVHSSYDPRLSLIEDDKYHDNANNRNDHNDSRYENSACFFPDNRSYDIRNNLPPNIPSCIEKTIDPSGNIIERVYLMPPQNLPNTYKKVQASLNTQQPLEDYKQFYNYENLAVPETPLLQRSTGSQQSPVASNFSPRSTGTWVNQSQPPFSNNYHQNNQQSSSHARSNVDSDNIGNNVTYDSSKFEQETLRNFSTANGRDNTQNFSNSQRPSRIPQQKLMGKGRGRGSLQQN